MSPFLTRGTRAFFVHMRYSISTFYTYRMQDITHKIKDVWQHAGFQKYFRNTGWLFISKVFILVINLCVSILIAKKLGPEQYGTFSFIISFVSIVGFTLFSIDSLLIKKLHDDKDQTKQILGSGIIIKLINSFVTILTVTLTAILFANTPTTILMVFVYSTFTIFQSFSVVDYYFKIHAKNKPVSLLTILVVIPSSLLKIGFLYYNAPLIYLLFSYVADHALNSIGYIYLYKKYIGNIFTIKPIKKIMVDLMVQSWPFSLSALAAAIYIRVDQIFIKVLLGSESLGLYAIAVRFSEVWFIIAEVLCISLLPAILNAEKDNQSLFLRRSKHLYSLLFYSAILICIGMYVLSPILIQTLYGDAYAQSIQILRLYIWSIIGFFILTGLNQFLLAENKFKTMLLLNIVGMVLSLTLNYTLIPIFGITGAVIANICAYTLPVIYIFIFFKRMKPQRAACIAGIFKPLT